MMNCKNTRLRQLQDITINKHHYHHPTRTSTNSHRLSLRHKCRNIGVVLLICYYMLSLLSTIRATATAYLHTTPPTTRRRTTATIAHTRSRLFGQGQVIGGFGRNCHYKSLLLSGRGGGSSHLGSRRMMMTTTTLSSGSTSTTEEHNSAAMFEVEQKFQLMKNNDGDIGGDIDSTTNQRIQQRLKELHFVPKKTIKFVDWYFDTNDNILSTQYDCWLRYRGLLKKEDEKGDNDVIVKGSWQLKKGQNDATSKTTVYQEIEGDEAVVASISVLIDNTKIIEGGVRDDDNNNVRGTNSPTTFDGYEIPKLPLDKLPNDQVKVGNLLIPFCRIVTTRSSWAFNGGDDGHDDTDFYGLDVDLDMTNSGYCVGEVEAVVEKEEDIPIAKERIQNLINEITQESNNDDNNSSSEKEKKKDKDSIPLGKLEHFLVNNRPDHYKACIESGSMQSKYNFKKNGNH